MNQERAAFFKIAEQVFALDGKALRRVVIVAQLTSVPRSSANLLGLFAERGNIFPLFDLRSLLRLESFQRTDLALLLHFQDTTFAISIDEMLGLFPYEHNYAHKAISKPLQGFVEAEISYQNYHATLLNIGYMVANFEESVA
jgi:purine-binding chemotaxis protein CheW